ncbi:MAG: hypothetical protein LBQ14_00805 [Treponema sp.]|nr:hypothetical protein [Treponema sp.]
MPPFCADLLTGFSLRRNCGAGGAKPPGHAPLVGRTGAPRLSTVLNRAAGRVETPGVRG